MTESVKLEKSWLCLLQDEFRQDYMKNLRSFLLQEKKLKKTIYPPSSEIFNALNLTPFPKVKVVILGQDPYHGINQAHGLSFSVKKGVRIPPSLQNIYKELNDDLGFMPPNHGNLSPWAEQGVLLLNATLTVRASEAGSHQNKGWEQFTDKIIRILSDRKKGLIFLLWGAYAKAKANLIDEQKHYILKAAHPSPFSAASGFFGCKHFSKTNDILLSENTEPVNWQI